MTERASDRPSPAPDAPVPPNRRGLFGLVLGLLGASGLMILFGVAAYVGRADTDQPAWEASGSAHFRGRVLHRPRPKPAFTLTDTEGRPFDFRAETEGQLTLLFFGYTHCPDVCPVHMANLAAVLGDLLYEVRSRVRVVFVTTDPARDTRARLREWLGAFDPGFVGLRGSLEQVNRILAELGLGSVIHGTPDASGNYTVGHPAQILAFTPDGLLRVVYPFGTRQIDWAHDLPKLLAFGAGSADAAMADTVAVQPGSRRDPIDAAAAAHSVAGAAAEAAATAMGETSAAAGRSRSSAHAAEAAAPVMDAAPTGDSSRPRPGR